jgi:predicted secreted Zn-dependent protease
LFKRVQRVVVEEEAREVKYQRKEVSFGGVVPLINLVARKR